MKSLTYKGCCALAAALLAGSAQAQYSYTGGRLNTAATYDGNGVDAGINPYTVPGTNDYMIGDGGWAGSNPGDGTLTVLSGTLTFNANDFKVGNAGAGCHGYLYLGQGATLNVNMVGSWGAGWGVAWAAASEVVLSNSATLNLMIAGSQEQRLLLGDNNTGTLTLLGGALNLSSGTGSFSDDNGGFNVGGGGTGRINLNAGTLTDASVLPFMLGGRWSGLNSTPYPNSSGTGRLIIGNGSFVKTGICTKTDPSKATFAIGTGSSTYVQFTGGTGSLSLTNWSLSDYTALVNSGKIRVGLPGGPGIRTTMDSFNYASSGGQGILTAKPFVGPSAAGVVTQVVAATVYEYTEASFTFAATNNGTPLGAYGMTYAWYKNNTLVSTNPMGPQFTFLTTPADNNAQIYAVASVADTNYSSVNVTSAVVTLTVNPGATVFTNGLKREFFAGASRVGVEIGSTGPGVVGLVSQADDPGGHGDNYTDRHTGYFIPPANDAYVFFLAADDDTDLFLSTDSTAANKRLIAQENSWSGTRNWQTAGGGGSVASQKRSDQWTNSIGEMPYTAGFYLLAGQRYYIESVHHNGGGGDNWAVTYLTTNEVALDPAAPANGTPSRMTAASNNIALVTFAGTTLAWSVQPQNTRVNEGGSTNFTCLALSDAEMLPAYQWYMNEAPVSGATGPSLNLGTIPASYNGAQIKVVASTIFGGRSITSSVATLYVSSAIFERSFIKNERWNNHALADLESGNVAATPDYEMAVPSLAVSIDNPDMVGNFVRRVSGYFIPAVTTNYVFFTTSDDESDLFLSTDNTPANKRLVCGVTGWNAGGNWQWLTANGGGIVSQSRSDQWTNSSGVAPYAAGIPLVAGQRYYIEQDFHQGGGGANNAATFKFVNEPDPTVGTPTRLTASLIAMNAVRCTYVAFTLQPTNVTTAPMSYVTFSADGTTDSTTPVGSIYGREEQQTGNYLFFQWYKNGVAIPGANGKSLTLGPLTGLDDGAQIYCAMRALGYADNSLNPIWTNSALATITLSPKAVFEPGYAWVEWWVNLDSRAAVENGSAGLPTYSFTAPKFACPTDGDEVGTYANRISGFFLPATTTNYVFWVNSDDDSDLFIGTNSSSIGQRLVAQESGWSGPFNWNTAGGGGSSAGQKRSDMWSPDGGYTQPYSTGIPLNAGQAYWLELVHHNGYWGGHNSMATCAIYNDLYPSNGDDTTLQADRIGIYAPRIPWVAFLQQPAGQTVTSGGNPVTFTVRGTNPPSVWIGTSTDPKHWLGTSTNFESLQYQWYKDGSPIPGATASSYTQPYVLPADQGAQFVCGLRALGYSDNYLNRIYSNSAPAVLTVVTDTVPPTVTYAATFVNSNQVPPQIIVDITFSEWMDPSTLTNIGSYTIAGVNITNITIASNHRTVQLLVDAVPSLPLTVTLGSGFRDLSGNALAGSHTAAINPDPLTFTDVGAPGSDPAYPSFLWVEASGGYLVEAQGSDIWGNADGFNFGWELKTNDFDVVVRGVKNGHTSQYAKMGLMVREALDASSREWCIVNDPVSSDGIMAPDNSGYGADRIEANMRDTYGGATGGGWQIGSPPAPAYPNAWLRLQRTGNVLSAFYSTNGVAWVQAGSYDTSTNASGVLSNVVYVGLSTTAHNNDSLVPPLPPPFKYYNLAEYADYNASYIPPATLSVHLAGGNVVVSWTPTGGRLLASPALAGPGVNWQPVGTANPATIAIGSGPVFFKVVNP